jgi:hypothetical protein
MLIAMPILLAHTASRLHREFKSVNIERDKKIQPKKKVEREDETQVMWREINQHELSR